MSLSFLIILKKRSLPFGKYGRRTIYSRERFRGVEKRVTKIGRALGGNVVAFYSPRFVWKFETVLSRLVNGSGFKNFNRFLERFAMV